MKVIGLTGGIGTGKSTVSAYLAQKGYYIIDADEMARELTNPGNPALGALKEAFGQGIFLPDGSLDRKALAEIVFFDKQKLATLTAITTDKVVADIFSLVEDLRNEEKYGIIFIDAPILFETGLDKCTDAVWLVDADDNTRIERVMTRDGATREQVTARMANQMARETKVGRSDVIIDNSQGREQLFSRIDELLKEYEI